MKKQYISKHYGFTLIEILVAMTISLILMGGVLQIFSSNKQTYRVIESSSRLQENARFSMEFLKQDIRKAGFQGCRARSSIPTTIIADFSASGAPDLDLTQFNNANGAVNGLDNVGADVTRGGQTVLQGTDILTIQYGGSCGGHLVGNMAADNANIQIAAPNDCDIQASWPLMITDCETADVFRPTGISTGASKETMAHADNVNVGNRLSKAYQTDAEILTLQSMTYFVAENADGVPSLYRQNIIGNSEELVTDIDDFQVLYGEDINRNDRVADSYLAAGAVTNMSNVVSIRINIRTRTPADNIALNANAITYDGGNITDRHIRRPFNSTVSLRNRQF